MTKSNFETSSFFKKNVCIYKFVHNNVIKLSQNKDNI